MSIANFTEGDVLNFTITVTEVWGSHSGGLDYAIWYLIVSVFLGVLAAMGLAFLDYMFQQSYPSRMEK